MATFADGKIEAYVGPTELGAADNLAQVIVDFIAGAKKSLDIAIQEIDSRTIAQAILDARWRGVRVQMLIEQDYIRSDLVGTPPKRPTPLPGETSAQALLWASERSGSPRLDLHAARMHPWGERGANLGMLKPARPRCAYVLVGHRHDSGIITSIGHHHPRA